ncbi:type II secretion system protein [Leptolyngbya sp. FACHB-671]|uniref:type II secretion system GspH family protein n=1 Tax=Leptolyngbya sp. FACHB-671 TaxID=2692812 RepID=UPI001685C12A|nr:type II secretion system GspH family protein [Leptolyngbya sp. FACHB-671]MBD1871136.1 type II secretion system protein [Cyanobacteria bacterium FACHB-471]MBD2069266.1 type II secretion system protein [Leptolyngbya sp. FACHB-671]
MKVSLKSQLNRLFRRKQKSSSVGGFTFIELLVVIFIAGGILSGLLYLVVELLGVDQREASRNETQREMQLAMDYIATELREAVYVYNDCYLPQGNRNDPDGDPNNPNDDYCPGLINFLPDNLTSPDNIPVVAFWKQQPIPTVLKERCASSATPPDDIPCRTASSYALVVYSINTADSDIWKGKARITRYALTQFQSNGTRAPGYAPPEEGVSVRFDRWPIGDNDTDRRVGTPLDTSAVLVDFLDDGSGADFIDTDETADLASCPDDYSMVPSQEVLDAVGAPDIRSFYACVDQGQSNTNRDVILYIRGNAQGRPGISGEASFLPTLETRVLSRGVLGRAP